MTFVADESVDGQIVGRLRQDGHTVWYVAELDPGIPDDAAELAGTFAVMTPGALRIRKRV